MATLGEQAKNRTSSSTGSLKAKAASRAAKKTTPAKPKSKGAAMTSYGVESDQNRTMKESKGVIPPLTKEAESPVVPHFDYITSYSRIPSLRKRPIGG